MNPSHPIAQDMRTLDSLLREIVAPHLPVGPGEDLRMLNIACGQCDEAGTLVNFGKSHTQGGDVSLIGADIRRLLLRYRSGEGDDIATAHETCGALHFLRSDEVCGAFLIVRPPAPPIAQFRPPS